MRIVIGVLLCVLLVSCENISTPNENRQGNAGQRRLDVSLAADSTFRVNNQTHVNVGTVSILLDDNTNATLNVSDSGMFVTHISTAPSSCTIHSQLLEYDTPTWITISAHMVIHATWTDNVVVIDKNEEN